MRRGPQLGLRSSRLRLKGVGRLVPPKGTRVPPSLWCLGLNYTDGAHANATAPRPLIHAPLRTREREGPKDTVQEGAWLFASSWLARQIFFERGQVFGESPAARILLPTQRCQPRSSGPQAACIRRLAAARTRLRPSVQSKNTRDGEPVCRCAKRVLSALRTRRRRPAPPPPP